MTGVQTCALPILPARHQHLISDSANRIRPLFVVFPDSPERIAKGLKGAGLPAITYAADLPAATSETASTPVLAEGELDVEAAETFDMADLDNIGLGENPPE